MSIRNSMISHLDRFVFNLGRLAKSTSDFLDRFAYAIFVIGLTGYFFGRSGVVPSILGQALEISGPSLATIAVVAKIYVRTRDKNPAQKIRRPQKPRPLASAIKSASPLKLEIPGITELEEVERFNEIVFRYTRRPAFSEVSKNPSERLKNLKRRLDYCHSAIAITRDINSQIAAISQIVPISREKLKFLLQGKLAIPELFEIASPSAGDDVALVLSFGTRNRNKSPEAILEHLSAHLHLLGLERFSLIATAVSEPSRRAFVKSLGFKRSGRTRNGTEIWIASI